MVVPILIFLIFFLVGAGLYVTIDSIRARLALRRLHRLSRNTDK